ncbi:MAG: hypothetical protein V4532_18640 [Pseudomonadota bacterium]
MKNHAMTTPFWSTASFGDTADTSPMELAALGEHLDVCKESHHRLFTLQCLAENLHGFISTHFVTTLVMIFALTIAVAYVVM